MHGVGWRQLTFTVDNVTLTAIGADASVALGPTGTAASSRSHTRVKDQSNVPPWER